MQKAEARRWDWTAAGLLFLLFQVAAARLEAVIVTAALEEAVDAVGISILSGAHLTLLGEVTRLMDHQKAGDIPLVAGGIIPVEDIPALKEMGVREIFLPATPTDEIVEFFKSLVQKV